MIHRCPLINLFGSHHINVSTPNIDHHHVFVRRTSMRRLERWRLLRVEAGWLLPRPRAVTEVGRQPRSMRYSRIWSARRWERAVLSRSSGLPSIWQVISMRRGMNIWRNIRSAIPMCSSMPHSRKSTQDSASDSQSFRRHRSFATISVY